MENRFVGYILIGVSVLIGFTIFIFNRALTEIINTSCSHGPACPMWGTLRAQTYVSLALLFALLAIGIYFVFAKEEKLKENAKREVIDYLADSSKLSEEEKKIIEAIKENAGSAYQNELASKLSISKVKLTRILDRLEGRKLLERKRRGMTNIIILK